MESISLYIWFVKNIFPNIEAKNQCQYLTLFYPLEVPPTINLLRERHNPTIFFRLYEARKKWIYIRTPFAAFVVIVYAYYGSN